MLVVLPPVRGLVLAMLVSMLFLLLLRFTAPVMVWVLIAGLLAAGAYGKLKEKRWHSPHRFTNPDLPGSVGADMAEGRVHGFLGGCVGSS